MRYINATSSVLFGLLAGADMTLLMMADRGHILLTDREAVIGLLSLIPMFTVGILIAVFRPGE